VEDVTDLAGPGSPTPTSSCTPSTRVTTSAGDPHTPADPRRAALRVLPLQETVVDGALRGVDTHGLSHYDAQIWAAARLAGAATLLTEDLQPGRDLEGVIVVDPFRGPRHP